MQYSTGAKTDCWVYLVSLGCCFDPFPIWLWQFLFFRWQRFIIGGCNEQYSEAEKGYSHDACSNFTNPVSPNVDYDWIFHNRRRCFSHESNVNHFESGGFLCTLLVFKVRFCFGSTKTICSRTRYWTWANKQVSCFGQYELWSRIYDRTMYCR